MQNSQYFAWHHTLGTQRLFRYWLYWGFPGYSFLFSCFKWRLGLKHVELQRLITKVTKGSSQNKLWFQYEFLCLLFVVMVPKCQVSIATSLTTKDLYLLRIRVPAQLSGHGHNMAMDVAVILMDRFGSYSKRSFLHL